MATDKKQKILEKIEKKVVQAKALIEEAKVLAEDADVAFSVEVTGRVGDDPEPEWEESEESWSDSGCSY